VLLAVMKLLGVVHRDIRPANVLRREVDLNLYCYTLVDFGYACDDGVRQPFSGGLCCASPRVLNLLYKEEKDEFEVYSVDDVFSWVRCCIFCSNYEIQLAYSQIKLQLDGVISIINFWEDKVTYCPKILYKPNSDCKMEVEDMWELVFKYPQYMSFVSGFPNFPEDLEIERDMITQLGIIIPTLLQILCCCIKFRLNKSDASSERLILKNLLNSFIPKFNGTVENFCDANESFILYTARVFSKLEEDELDSLIKKLEKIK
jgi:serine/threonine protein kinase